MNILTNLKNQYFLIFAVLLFSIGIFLSINAGITHDEFHDYNVWEVNKNLILNFFLNTNYETQFLSDIGKFYGVGFHYLSIPFEIITSLFLDNSFYSDKVKAILSKHVTVFFLFILSGIFFQKILNLIIENNFYSNLGGVLYLTYPYLLGHSFFNVKDIPFLSIWLICTYLIIKISKILVDKKTISKKYFISISFFTALLLSIRISGILIFIQYAIMFCLHLNRHSFFFKDFLINNYKNLILSFISIFLLFYLLQPSSWENPFYIFESIKAMSQHEQTVCTTTLGECMKAQKLPSTYLPIWFFFKLPLVIIFGFILFPIIEKKIVNESFSSFITLSLIFSTTSIILLLILFEVNLYDEIRQVMFLLPSFFLISLSMIYFFSKKIFKILLLLSISFFLLQNIILYPYNYIWINNFSHLTKINGVFELDYWGVSTKAVANYFNKNKKNKQICIISNRNGGVKALVQKDHCFSPFKNLHKKNERPFYVALLERGIKKGSPNRCNTVFEEKRQVNFSSEDLILAKIFKCD